MKPLVRMTIAVTVIGAIAVKHAAIGFVQKRRSVDGVMDKFFEWVEK